ncbi:protein EFR3-like [Teratosphaeria destructans]|uniref:Protein EFR3-like n=1 Tax=Teratosphaeria destructans TaxID=418781 RepID=A0A9W7W3K7_9PEZI|nr:protein EFR3-like [Teratosphaeria destructans]
MFKSKTTHLPGHLDSVRTKIRPKHQLLILKCYPRLPKNATTDEAKPNGSELSYLLYYAATRRSKLQKVGAFLEKKTASDVYKQQSARVIVTLHILTALVDNKVAGEGSSLALIAPYVVRIISGILRDSDDIGLIAATLHTWDVFCRHPEQALLAPDWAYCDMFFTHVVTPYNHLAQKTNGKKLGNNTIPVASHDAIRLREIGLRAQSSVLHSAILDNQIAQDIIHTIIPCILSNMRGADQGQYVRHLVELSNKNSEEEKDKAAHPRPSMATVRTHRGSVEGVETDPRSAAGTAQDADAFAEERVAVLALDTLKEFFCNDNRGQIKQSAMAVLKHMERLQLYQTPAAESAPSRDLFKLDSWSLEVFKLCTAWTPVQDRFVLIITATQVLVAQPLTLENVNLKTNLLYVNLISHILASDLNLIGLSVMDVLLSLLSHTLKALQSPVPITGASHQGAGRTMLVEALEDCIANLATHVYYSEQIGDMIAVVLHRIRSDPASVAAASTSPGDVRRYFDFEQARVVALQLVCRILSVASQHRPTNASGENSRNTVHISNWEGTQFLLNDPSPHVRKAYVEALVAWLDTETTKSDFRLSQSRSVWKRNRTEDGIVRRAVSNASATKGHAAGAAATRSPSQTFLQLLHVANYEHALKFTPSSPSDVLLTFTLQAKLVEKLGINETEDGLPMMLALQEQIPAVGSPRGKIRIGSLVHGYLWTIVEIFGCQDDAAGKEIRREIDRRKACGTWAEEIKTDGPRPSIDAVTMNPQDHQEPVLPATSVGQDLIPFDSRDRLVDSILDHYQRSIASPPSSAPGSPGRSFSMSPVPPTERASSYLGAKPTVIDPMLLNAARSAMMSTWNKEERLKVMAATAPRSVSGSQSSPQNGGNLAAAVESGMISNHRQLLAVSPQRRPSGSSAGRASSAGVARAPVRVDDLKDAMTKSTYSPMSVGSRRFDPNDTASESMVEVADEDLESDVETRKTSKFDVNGLLASIVIESPAPRKGRMEEPPY